MKILLAEDDPVVSELVQMNLEALTMFEILSVNPGNDALELLEKHQDIGIVICDYTMPNGNGDIVYKYIKKNKLNIPFILISIDIPEELPGFGMFYKDNPKNKFFEKPFDYDEFINYINTALDIEPMNIKEDYCKVNINRLYRFNVVNVAVFIKISNNKFIKIINQNDPYTHTLLDNYKMKNCLSLYIKKDDYEVFSKFFSKELAARIKDNNQDHEQLVNTKISGISFIHEQLSQLGITESAKLTINNLTESSLKILSNNPQIFELIKNVIAKEDYIYEHSLLLSYISGAMAMQMDWGTDSTLKKIIIASLIHDLGFDDTELAMFHDLDTAFDLQEIEQKNIDLIKKHTIKMSEEIRNMKWIPPDVDSILINHHEKPNGSGYPRGLSTKNIPPLACLFIIAEDFVRRIYCKDIKDIDIQEIINNFEATYKTGHFKKIFESLKSLICPR